MSRELAAGVVRTSFGVLGEVKIHSFSGEVEHLKDLKMVTLRGGQTEKNMTVESSRLAGGMLVMKFKGVDSPEAAKLLAGLEIWIDRSQAAPLKKNEFYMTDLIGCKLVDDSGERGTVTGYLEGGATELLEVQKPDGSQVVVPFMDKYLGKVDVEQKTIELRLDWILE